MRLPDWRTCVAWVVCTLVLNLAAWAVLKGADQYYADEEARMAQVVRERGLADGR